MAFADVMVALWLEYPRYILLIGTAMLVLLYQKLKTPMDSREPPLVTPTVPLIGHAIKILSRHNHYFEDLEAKYHHDIFTIATLKSKTYIITSPELYSSALKSKSLDFLPFEVMLADRMVDIGPHAMKTISGKVGGRFPFMEGFHRASRQALQTGPSLTKMNLAAMAEIAETLNSFDDVFEAKSLYNWCRDFFTKVTAVAMYGKQHNPIFPPDGPDLLEPFWEFNCNFLWLLPQILSSVIAKKTYQARLTLQKAYADFYANNYDADPSIPYVNLRAKHHRSFGFNNDEVGKLELTLLFNATSNTIPTLFWFLSYLFSSPSLVAAVAEEAKSITVTTVTNGITTNTLDITKLLPSCPHLFAAWNEMLRLQSNQVSLRFVTADTTVTDGTNTYLLKKGNLLQLPAGIMHRSPAIWGPDADEFRPSRFLHRTPSYAPRNASSSTLRKDETPQERLQRLAFLPFGGGKHLCPGRMFALTEILGLGAALCVGWEAEGLYGGPVELPESGWRKLAETMPMPTEEGMRMGVRLTRRKGMEREVWKFVAGEK